MALISFRLSRELLAQIDELVINGTYASRSEAFRSAISQLLREDALAEARKEVKTKEFTEDEFQKITTKTFDFDIDQSLQMEDY